MLKFYHWGKAWKCIDLIFRKTVVIVPKLQTIKGVVLAVLRVDLGNF